MIINSNNEELIATLNEIKMLIISLKPNENKILKSNEVKKMLGISHGTLQKYRDEGIIAYTKIGGVIYYYYSDVINLINKNKVGGDHV